MTDFASKLDSVMRFDNADRGLPSCVQNPVDELISSLKKISSAIILTGFPVKTPKGDFVCESDGPLGCADIAYAFEQLGIPVCVVSDSFAKKTVDIALKSRSCRAECFTLNPLLPLESFSTIISLFSPTHLITIERPGKSADGHYYSMRGASLDGYIADSGDFIKAAHSHGVSVISIGDGGNELGMGNYREKIEAYVPNGKTICANEKSDIALISGISNYWGWGIAAVLSKISGKDLLPSRQTAEKMLAAITEYGAVDGKYGIPRLSVDGVELPEYLSVLDKVRNC